MSTLSQLMGLAVNENHISLDPESKRSWMTRDWKNFTIREIVCAECGQVIFGVVSEDIYNADLVWPIKVICANGASTHQFMLREHGEDAGAVCNGRAATEAEAKAWLERYVK